MLFYILMVFLILLMVIPVVAGIFSGCDPEVTGASLLLALMLALIPAGVFFTVWTGHAGNLSTIENQSHRIEVYENRIGSLKSTLNNAQYPTKPGISLDADTPWASMINALSDAETQLAKVMDERAIAIRKVEATRRGPMSGVIRFAGDYEL